MTRAFAGLAVLAAIAAVAVRARRPPPVTMTAGMFRFEAASRLASVNGSPILGKDLAAAPLAFAPATYQRLLGRAIERELVFQAARAQGVDLSPAQRRQLEEMRAARERREPGVTYLAGHQPEDVDFQIRDAEGLFLQAALLERGGTPPPHVTPADVQGYYREHRDEFGDAPWLEIDRRIRDRLASDKELRYGERARELLGRLKAEARIVETTAQQP